MNYAKTPFPWFGGKSDASPAVWAALGDVPHYVEPFAGSLAVLLRRPHVANRAYHSETVNDMDGLLVNAWRAIQMSPDAVADAASWPISEADLHARHLAIVRWRAERQLEHLMGDPRWHDPVMAGWWMWGQSAWIGSGWASGRGPWTVDASGRIEKRRAEGVGTNRQRPRLNSNGNGVAHASARAEGVGTNRKLPRLGDDGCGVAHASARAEGVGTNRKRPPLVNNGNGVAHASARAEGVGTNRQLPPGIDYHPMTMPELLEWMRFLSARLRHVRIVNGDWQRVLTTGAAHTVRVRMGYGPCGIFLDPPYADSAGRTSDLYTVDCEQVAHAVREWAIKAGDDPRNRIVLAGFAHEHENEMPPHWRCVEWYRAGFLRGGMGNQSAGPSKQLAERLWLSPACIGATEDRQVGMFAAGAP